MNQIKLTKTFIMIQNEKKPFQRFKGQTGEAPPSPISRFQHLNMESHCYR